MEVLQIQLSGTVNRRQLLIKSSLKQYKEERGEHAKRRTVNFVPGLHLEFSQIFYFARNGEQENLPPFSLSRL